MKKILAILIIIISLSGCVYESAQLEMPEVSQYEPEEYIKTLWLGSAESADSPAGYFLDEFANNVEQLSGGDLIVLVFHSESAGTQSMLANDIDNGDIDIALLPTEEGSVANVLFSTPFVLDNNNIFDVMTILESNNFGYSGFPEPERISFVNCGSLHLSVSQQATTEQLFGAIQNSNTATDGSADEEPPEEAQITDEPIEDDLPQTIESTEVTLFENEYENYYIAKTEHSYDVKVLTLSQHAVTDLTGEEYEIIIKAAAEAQISAKSEFASQEFAAAESLMRLYEPEGLYSYINELPSLEERLDLSSRWIRIMSALIENPTTI